VVVVDVGVLQWWWAATPNFESQKSWGEISLRREREREREREGENFGYPPPLRHWIMVVVRGDIGGEWWLGF
jgi:hypothetical protein